MARPARKPARNIIAQQEGIKIRAEAIKLRIQGYSYDEIATILQNEEQIASASEQRVRKIVAKALKKPTFDADKLRALESLRFDMLHKVHFSVAMGNPQRDTTAKPNEDGSIPMKQVEYHDQFKATQLCLKIAERRATMLGLNKQPTFTLATSEQVRACTVTLAEIHKDANSPDDPEEAETGAEDSGALGSESVD